MVSKGYFGMAMSARKRGSDQMVKSKTRAEVRFAKFSCAARLGSPRKTPSKTMKQSSRMICQAMVQTYRYKFLPFTAIALACLCSSHAAAQKLLGVHTFNITAIGGAPSRQASIQQLGAQAIRLPVTWHLMEESTKGVTPSWFWSQLDAEVAAAGTLGAKLIITLGQTPCWASSDPNKNCAAGTWNVLYPPTNVQDYADAIRIMAARYKGKVYAYEIWNEPNLVYSWSGQPSRTAPYTNDAYGSFVSLNGAVKYAQIVVAAYPAVKAGDAGALVLAGSIAGGDTEYLTTLYQNAGFKNSFDAISMHPYTAEYPGNNPTGARFGPNECPAGSAFWCSAVGVNNIRNVMVANGNAAKNIWFTEFGFSSSHYWNGSDSVPAGSWDSENGQARYLNQMVTLIKNWSFVAVACWYDLADTAPHEPRLSDAYNGEREAHYGLYYSDGSNLKQSGAAFMAAVQSINATAAPLIVSPNNATASKTPTYIWRPAAGATQYKIWLNNYASTGVDYNGRIDVTLSPAQAGCSATQCSYKPATRLFTGFASWWVTSVSVNGTQAVSAQANFTVQ
jgi:hypothetical protein